MVTFLSPIKQELLLPIGLINLNDLQACQDLQDHSSSDYRTDPEFHETASVAGQDCSHPVEGVWTRVLYYPVQRDLTADKVDQQWNERPDQLVFECHLLITFYLPVFQASEFQEIEISAVAIYTVILTFYP